MLSLILKFDSSLAGDEDIGEELRHWFLLRGRGIIRAKNLC